MQAGDNKRFWQRAAGFYGFVVCRTSGKLYNSLRERISSGLRRDMTVLELACGSGQLSLPLCGHTAVWEATDLSEAMIAKAKKYPHSSRLRFTVMDAAALSYEHDTFDAVVIVNALHIIPQPERVLREIRRVLKPGGVLYAPTYMHGGIRRPSLRMRLMKLAGFEVLHKWNAGEFLSLLDEYGFTVKTAAILPDTLAPVCYTEAVVGK